jgi:uncharacterized membrane protein
MNDASADKPRKSRFVLSLLLAISLLFNALALGVGVRLYQARQSLIGDGGAVALPRDLRRDLTKALAAHRAGLAPALRSVQLARREAVEAASQQSYDPVKAAAALDRLRGAIDQLMAEVQGVVLQELARRAGD